MQVKTYRIGGGSAGVDVVIVQALPVAPENPAGKWQLVEHRKGGSKATTYPSALGAAYAFERLCGRLESCGFKLVPNGEPGYKTERARPADYDNATECRGAMLELD